MASLILTLIPSPQLLPLEALPHHPQHCLLQGAKVSAGAAAAPRSCPATVSRDQAALQEVLSPPCVASPLLSTRNCPPRLSHGYGAVVRSWENGILAPPLDPRRWAHIYPRGTGQGGAVRLGHVGCLGINPIPHRSIWGPFMGWEGWVAVIIHNWEPELGCSSSHPRFIPCAACIWAENAPVPTSSGSRVAARRFPTPKGAGSRGWGQAGRAASPLTVPCPRGASWRTAAGTCRPPAPGTRCRGRGPCGSRGECGWLRGQGTRLSGDGHGAPKGRLSPRGPAHPGGGSPPGAS